jgi:hypothetical protein
VTLEVRPAYYGPVSGSEPSFRSSSSAGPGQPVLPVPTAGSRCRRGAAAAAGKLAGRDCDAGGPPADRDRDRQRLTWSPTATPGRRRPSDSDNDHSPGGPGPAASHGDRGAENKVPRLRGAGPARAPLGSPTACFGGADRIRVSCSAHWQLGQHWQAGPGPSRSRSSP